MTAESPEGEQESGSALRTKLEEALKGIGELKETNAGLLAEKVIRDKGLTYVKPEDLKGVDVSEFENRANEIEATRTTERQELLKSVLEENGLSEELLTKGGDAARRVASLGALGGTPPAQQKPEVAPGPERIGAALGAKQL